MKPDKIPFFKFYFGWTQDVWRLIKINVFGMWYCEHCNKFHGARVVRYKYRLSLFTERYACSIGADAMSTTTSVYKDQT